MKKTVKKVVEVFDLERFIGDHLDSCSLTAVKNIVRELKLWAYKCDGLTTKEAEAKYHGIISAWCIKKEVEVEVPINELCTPFEKELLSKVNKKFKDGYVAKDKDGTVAFYTKKPVKRLNKDIWGGCGYAYAVCLPFTDLFPFISWEDEEPYKISELIG